MKTVVVGLILAFLLFTSPGQELGMDILAAGVGTLAGAFATIAVILGGAWIVYFVRREPAVAARPVAPAPLPPPDAANDWAHQEGVAGIARALIPRANRRPMNETEFAAWSELAGAFEDEHKQQGWR
jgi:hypothetical protein